MIYLNFVGLELCAIIFMRIWVASMVSLSRRFSAPGMSEAVNRHFRTPYGVYSKSALRTAVGVCLSPRKVTKEKVKAEAYTN
jgi:hypothetical protein